jgi:hypothetical protein
MSFLITAARNSISYIKSFGATTPPVIPPVIPVVIPPINTKSSKIDWIKNHKAETIGMAVTAVLTTALIVTAVASCVFSFGATGLIACAALGVGATTAAIGTGIVHLATNPFVPIKLKEKEKEKEEEEEPTECIIPSNIPDLTFLAGGAAAGLAIGGSLLGLLSFIL